MSHVIDPFCYIAFFCVFELIDTAISLDDERKSITVKIHCSDYQEFVNYPMSNKCNGFTIVPLGNRFHEFKRSIKDFLKRIPAGDANGVRASVPCCIFLRPRFGHHFLCFTCPISIIEVEQPFVRRRFDTVWFQNDSCRLDGTGQWTRVG